MTYNILEKIIKHLQDSPLGTQPWINRMSVNLDGAFFVFLCSLDQKSAIESFRKQELWKAVNDEVNLEDLDSGIICLIWADLSSYDETEFTTAKQDINAAFESAIS